MADFPTDIAGLAHALVTQREYTLGLYANLPPAYWEPAAFPNLRIVNPPLWELCHIAWFAEFFCLRWRADDPKAEGTASCMAGSDLLFDSAAVAHADRWTNHYPSRDRCFAYMRQSLGSVLTALERSKEGSRYFFQLAIAHEDMHAEALAMTLNTLGLELPGIVSRRSPLVGPKAADINIEGGRIALGESRRSFSFDNEMPSQLVEVAPFAISPRVVSAAEFGDFCDSADYQNDLLWSPAGAEWRRSASKPKITTTQYAAMHVNCFQAEAWCRWAGRRLPTESEWEFAATNSKDMLDSTGHVWEWTATLFNGYSGFTPGPYRDYSAPWFGNHRVLRGGSFVTNDRLKYPQYRNFYTPDRSDMFCGFRTCAIV